MHSRIKPLTNISKDQYEHLVDEVEHDPLIRHSTLTVLCLIAAISLLSGGIIWFSKTNPGNLVRSRAKITYISSGPTDNKGTITTFVTFNFKDHKDQAYMVRQPYSGPKLEVNDTLSVGYNPLNPRYARVLSDINPPLSSYMLWTLPFVMMLGTLLLALYRHHERQLEIWQAAEAADATE
jgi:hypothetical protein